MMRQLAFTHRWPCRLLQSVWEFKANVSDPIPSVRRCSSLEKNMSLVLAPPNLSNTTGSNSPEHKNLKTQMTLGSSSGLCGFLQQNAASFCACCAVCCMHLLPQSPKNVGFKWNRHLLHVLLTGLPWSKIRLHFDCEFQGMWCKRIRVRRAVD